MGTGIRYTDEFKQEAVNQILIHGYEVADIANRLGVSAKGFYKWMKLYYKSTKQRQSEHDLQSKAAV